jgi:hypothetical protein
VVREHFERAASLYNQRVKDAVTAEKRDPDHFLVAQAQGMCYANFLKRFQNTPFDICVLNYHPVEDCVARVLARFGFPQGQTTNQPPRNVSLSRKALVASLAANRVSVTPKERSSFVAALRRIPGFYAPSGFIFGTEAAFQAERKFRKDRNFLLRRFEVELPLAGFSKSSMPFAIDEKEFKQISEVSAKFGSYGQRILDAVRPYVRG